MGGRKARRRRAERLDLKPNYALRRSIVVGALAAFWLAVVYSAFERQVIDHAYLQYEGERRYLRLLEIPARRGTIVDRNGEPLAISTPVASVWADPSKLVTQPETVRALARALEIEPARLMARLEERREKAFLYLRRRASPEHSAAVESIIAKTDGTLIGLEPEYRRFYPSGEIFGHLIGFTDIDDRGIEGLELAYDGWLSAEPGLRRVIQDGRRRVVEEVERVRPPRHGQELVLTIDRRLQFIAYRELKRAVEEHNAKAASAVVVDVATGEILAMVNQPAYNPNSGRAGKGETRRNRALTDVFEPGSTMKPFVVAAALEQGLLTPNTPIDTNPGYMRVGRNRVRDIHNYGRLNTTSVITKSSNVGVVKIAQRMDRERLWSLYREIGFGRPTDVGFPGESRGLLRHHGDWSDFEYATHAFGYGLAVTAVQLAQAYSVLAADGVRRPLQLLRHGAASELPERVLSVQTARTTRAIMETVVSDKGTARRAAIDGYRVAGKTGTAKKAVDGGYAAKRFQAVFAGMAPASEPRFVMVVVVDEPRGKHYYGGIVAAPVFARVMTGALRLYNVPPDDPAEPLLLAGGRR